MVDLERLNHLIDDSGITNRALAKKMGICEASLSNKRKGETQYTLVEAGILRECLNIGSRDFINIFFVTNVGEKPTRML